MILFTILSTIFWAIFLTISKMFFLTFALIFAIVPYSFSADAKFINRYSKNIYKTETKISNFIFQHIIGCLPFLLYLFLKYLAKLATHRKEMAKGYFKRHFSFHDDKIKTYLKQWRCKMLEELLYKFGENLHKIFPKEMEVVPTLPDRVRIITLADYQYTLGFSGRGAGSLLQVGRTWAGEVLVFSGRNGAHTWRYTPVHSGKGTKMPIKFLEDIL